MARQFPTDVFGVVLEFALDWRQTWRRGMVPVLEEMRQRYRPQRRHGPGACGVKRYGTLCFMYRRYSVFGDRGLPLIEMELEDMCRSSLIFTSESARRWWHGTGR